MPEASPSETVERRLVQRLRRPDLQEDAQCSPSCESEFLTCLEAPSRTRRVRTAWTKGSSHVSSTTAPTRPPWRTLALSNGTVTSYVVCDDRGPPPLAVECPSECEDEFVDVCVPHQSYEERKKNPYQACTRERIAASFRSVCSAP